MNVPQRLFAIIPTRYDQAEDFLLSRPRYFQAGKARNVSLFAYQLLTRTDFFEFELRQYVAGVNTTDCHINQTEQDFLKFDEKCAGQMIRFSLKVVEATLLENEWYEFMPRYTEVRRRLEDRFTILAQSRTRKRYFIDSL